MPKLHHFAAVMAALFTLAFAASAVATPVSLNLRVEGPNSTLFEGPVTSDVVQVPAADSSTHVVAARDCDGVHNGGSPDNPYGYAAAGATATSTLYDTANKSGLAWDATWYAAFDDIIVNTLGPDAPAPGTYWTFFINWKTDPTYGGCANQVSSGDDLLWTTWDYSSPLL